MGLQINTLREIDLSTVTVDDLRFLRYSFSAHSTGRGYWKKVTVRNGIETRIGDIEIDVWLQAVEAVSRRDGFYEELQRMAEFSYKNNEVPAFTRKELYFFAVDGTLDEIYKDPVWVWFIDYNRQFHPDLLAAANLVEIVTDCCGAKATYTEERLAREGDHIHCPVCKAWTAYHRDVQQDNTKGCET